MKLRITKDGIVEILIFIILFVSSSFVITNNIISSAATIALWLVTFFVIVISVITFRIHIRFGLGSPLVIGLLLIACVWITDLLNHENILTTGKFTFALITVSLIASIESFDSFREKYIHVLFLLSTISIILFLAYQFLPVLRGVNVVHNLSGRAFSNLYLFVYNMSLLRNCGMFWEPGAFGAYLCLALLFEMTGSRPRVRYMIVFLSAIVTTFSTTAYISTILIVLYMLLLNYGTSKRIKGVLFLLILIAVMGVFINYDMFFGQYGGSTVFGKLIRFYEGTSHSEYTSTSIRVNAVIYGALAFISSPIIGHGYSGLRELMYIYTLGMNTCTFVNWFAVYGLLFGSLMIIGYYNLCVDTQKKPGKLGAYIMLLILFTVTISENFVNAPMFILLGLYGHRLRSI